MPVIINAKATSLEKKIFLAMISLIFHFVDDILIHIIIFHVYRTSKQYRKMNVLEFLEWIYPMEKLLVLPMWILTTSLIFAYAHVDISYEPARNAGLGPLEPGAPIDGNNAEDAATQHAVGNQESQPTMPLTLDHRNDQRDNPDEDDDYDDKSTAAVSEQFTEADMVASVDSDDTAVDTDARPPSPRDLLGPDSSLTQILTMSSPNEASDTVPGPGRASVSILTQRRLQTPLQTPEQAVNDIPGTPSQTSVEFDDQTPNAPCPIRRRRNSPGTHIAPQSSGRSVLGAFASPAPLSASAGFLPRSLVSSPSLSLVATAPEDDNTSPTCAIPSRKEYKEMLYQEAREWPYILFAFRLKELIHYDEDDDRLPLPDFREIERQQHIYEAWARMRIHMNNVKPIRVYGTPALFPLDRLRCWVLTNNHRARGTPFPPNYVPIGDGVDCFNEALSVSSHGSIDFHAVTQDIGFLSTTEG